MTDTTGSNDESAARRARVRRMTIILALVALSFYVGFILMQVMGAR
jgi:uncharacterized membrane protein (DUF485 family)